MLVHSPLQIARSARAEEAIKAFDDVVVHFGEAAEESLRTAVAIAHLNKGSALDLLEQPHEAEAAYLRATQVDVPFGMAWIALGDFRLDRTGDPDGAVEAYLKGLAIASTDDDRAILHANCAYALALHKGDFPAAREHVQQGLADGVSISASGRSLLEALTWLGEPVVSWARVFEQIGKAVDADDSKLWSIYLTDLQRLIWYVIANGQGNPLRRWMEDAQYPTRYAPLYEALVAAIEGDDHLLRINPEVRQVAARIHGRIARWLRLYDKNASRQARKDRSTISTASQ